MPCTATVLCPYFCSTAAGRTVHTVSCTAALCHMLAPQVGRPSNLSFVERAQSSVSVRLSVAQCSYSQAGGQQLGWMPIAQVANIALLHKGSFSRFQLHQPCRVFGV